jgi:IS30 family transposase
MDVSESEEDIAIDPEALALGRGLRITPGQRMEIVHLTKQRWSQRRIALRLGVCKRTVKRWIDRYREEFNVKSHVNENGRPQKSDEEEDFWLACSG